jgi:hypothetical protein
MKKLLIYIIAAFCILATGCIKNELVTWKGQLVEFDANSWNANNVGVDYPVIVQLPAFGRPVIPENNACNSTTVDPFITRTSGTIRLRINLISAPPASDLQVGIKTFTVPFTSVSFRKKTPSCGNYTIPLINAVAGTDFTLPASLTIPKDSSFGYLDIVIRDNGATANQFRAIGLQIDSSGTVKPTTNYSRLVVAIDQR